MKMLVSISVLVLLFSLRSQGIVVPGVCFGLVICALCISGVATIWKAGKEYQKSHDEDCGT